MEHSVFYSDFPLLPLLPLCLDFDLALLCFFYAAPLICDTSDFHYFPFAAVQYQFAVAVTLFWRIFMPR